MRVEITRRGVWQDPVTPVPAGTIWDLEGVSLPAYLVNKVCVLPEEEGGGEEPEGGVEIGVEIEVEIGL